MSPDTHARTKSCHIAKIRAPVSRGSLSCQALHFRCLYTFPSVSPNIFPSSVSYFCLSAEGAEVREDTCFIPKCIQSGRKKIQISTLSPTCYVTHYTGKPHAKECRDYLTLLRKLCRKQCFYIVDLGVGLLKASAGRDCCGSF